ncbi:uncharacterized protein LOC34622127 [Cyclospora cayetanensis]|uniref:Uncharacterized protein LOC34622127 n=1 Tax=Cyclospora cayetanensis TaxID=88456 RepID=A0A6P6RZS2_9EIME|nr:uncharacterized protein LOC34622127 [Cyclospora cayetanensis]
MCSVAALSPLLKLDVEEVIAYAPRRRCHLVSFATSTLHSALCQQHIKCAGCSSPRTIQKPSKALPVSRDHNLLKAFTCRGGRYSALEGKASCFSCRQWLFPVTLTRLDSKIWGIAAGSSVACKLGWDEYVQRRRIRQMSTGLGGQSESDGPSSSCGFSYSQFVRQCSECLTDRQLERVAMRLKAYKGLKKTPRAQNKLTVIRDIGKIVPQEHRDSLTKLLSDSLDIVDPHHFLRLSKVSAERICIQDEVGDGIPQSIMGDYTVGAQILSAQRAQQNLRRLDRTGSATCSGCYSFASQAFSGCGTIVNLEIFDDRLRTLDQTDDNTMQAKGEQAIKDKLERRFSPIFALAEFSSTQEKENACSTYLRTFGVPCIDRLVYPEDAAVKKTLIATNLPFVLTPDEIARILAFALVQDSENNRQKPGTCRIRMTNPGLFGYDQLLVEARSDAPEPFFVLPLHEKILLTSTEFFMNRLVLNNDGLFVLRFGSFEAAEAAVRRCRGTVIYDSKALLLFSPRRCVYHNGHLVDFVIPEGNFASGGKQPTMRM